MAERYIAASRNMQRRFDRLTERAPVAQVSELYDREVSNAFRGITETIRSRRNKDMTFADQRAIMAHVRVSMRNAGQSVVAEISGLQAEAHADSISGLMNFVRDMEGRRPSIDTPTNLRRILRERREDMDATLRQVVSRNVAESITRINDALSALRASESVNAQAQVTVEDLMQAEIYRMQRIVRTETAYAYNAGQSDGIVALRELYPDVMSRWVEHVSDTTWEPTDTRTAKDSIALHGQVVDPGRLFTMPKDRSVPSDLWGQTWAFPPNRPNDRAVIAPWRRGWNIPAWKLKGTGRQWLVRY